MKEAIIKFCRRYQQQLLYLFFGVCTMAINTVAYGVLCEALLVNNSVSTVLAWLLAVIFAFVTNKILVFRSKRTMVADRVKELFSFFACRLLTGGLDLVIMVVAVDLLHGNNLLWKLISNIIVTIINYVASRLLIFKS